MASHQIKFPDIPGRFLKIPDGAGTAGSTYHFNGWLHLPYTNPLPSPFNASISSFRHIQYLQLLYLSKWQFFFICYICSQLQMQTINASLAKAKFPEKQQNSLTFQSKQNSVIFPDVPESGNRAWFWSAMLHAGSCTLTLKCSKSCTLRTTEHTFINITIIISSSLYIHRK